MKVILPTGTTRTAAVLLIVLTVALLVYSIAPYAEAAAHIDRTRLKSVTGETSHTVEAVTLACPGRIEGTSDVVSVGAAIDGLVRAVYVKEGQTVHKGDVLAELDCTDLQSAVEVATASRDGAREVRKRLQRGSRQEDREAAAQKTGAARAILEQATTQLDRMSKLYQAAEVSRLTFEIAQRDWAVAEAQLKQADSNEELANAGPLPEETARADADVRSAEAGIKLAADKLGKCAVRAPINGTILRVLLRNGESFGLLVAHPLFTIADASGRRVRAEVDENDVANVHLGQRVLVSSDAFSHRTFSGIVTRLGTSMGRTSVVTGDPAQKADRDILEVMADLNQQSSSLPIGLRVTVQFVGRR
jgi:ABC exporter DevB family membrane fusion protein